MEIVKAILSFLTSFFQSKTAQTKADVKLADAETTAVVETIAASSNATAVQTNQKASDAVQELVVKQEEVRKAEKKKPIKKRINDQFGSDQ
jgi:DNA gyrase/topoisomerase IV subunit B